MSRHVDEILDLIDSVLDVGDQHSSEQGMYVLDQSATEMLAEPLRAVHHIDGNALNNGTANLVIIDDPPRRLSRREDAVMRIWFEAMQRVRSNDSPRIATARSGWTHDDLYQRLLDHQP